MSDFILMGFIGGIAFCSLLVLAIAYVKEKNL